MIEFVSRERAIELVGTEPVVFAEVVAGTDDARSLEVHVMRPTGGGLHEVVRDDTGPLPDETVREHVTRIVETHGARYAVLYPGEEKWPPTWADPGRE